LIRVELDFDLLAAPDIHRYHCAKDCFYACLPNLNSSGLELQSYDAEF
jgi:hypothetical protein